MFSCKEEEEDWVSEGRVAQPGHYEENMKNKSKKNPLEPKPQDTL